jgi:hypothetical protein
VLASHASRRRHHGICEQLRPHGVERGIYRQPNGRYAVYFSHASQLRFRTVGFDLAIARRERAALIAAARRLVPVSPRLRLRQRVWLVA